LIDVNHEYVACSGVSKLVAVLPCTAFEEQLENSIPEPRSKEMATPFRRLRATDEP
jgi:hypothetical protein